ncbi:hypothetical protein KXW36_001632, partial [Aspergillus fumigatus]
WVPTAELKPAVTTRHGRMSISALREPGGPPQPPASFCAACERRSPSQISRRNPGPGPSGESLWHFHDVGPSTSIAGPEFAPVAMLLADFLGTPVWMWLAFLTIVIALLALDLGVLHRKSQEISLRESLVMSAIYIAL